VVAVWLISLPGGIQYRTRVNRLMSVDPAPNLASA
jgi:hypothetical protein